MLTVGDLGRLQVRLFSEQEQAVIIEILDTLDTQIRRTEEVIAKLKQVKQGLLTDLFTRGIDENGELRPPPEEAPELYKDSPLGKVPRDWRIAPIMEIGEIVTGATPPASDPAAWGQHVPFVTPVDIGETNQVYSTERMISERGLRHVRQVPSGSTLVVCIGSTIGKVGLAAVPVTTNQQVNAVIPSDKNNSSFIFLAIHSYIRQILAWAGLQAVPIVNKSTFGSMQIPLPPEPEQTAIANRAKALEERMVGEKAVLEKLRHEKESLMNDLLTGRVRVTPLLEQAEKATG